MNPTPVCCVCGDRCWKALGEHTYSLSEIDGLTEYAKKRYRVLFEVWCPGQQKVTMISSACQSCGFVTNLPRPSVEEVDAKYRFLAELGQDYGDSESADVIQKRSQAVYDHCKRYLPHRARILDYGGGDGRLMEPFHRRGHECFLVDYNANPQPFVTKLADTIEQVESGVFDFIICNHVIEHVAEPVETIRALSQLLVDDGVIYVEVPQEIWRAAPLHGEPVTHINFFVAESLQRVLHEAGLHVVFSRHSCYVHPSGNRLPAVYAVGRRRSSAGGPVANGLARVEGLLSPKWPQRLSRIWSLRSKLPEMIAYQLGLKK